MILLRFLNLKSLNISLQVGDAVYATLASPLLNDASKKGADINVNKLVGILRKIDNTANNNYDLYVDDTGYNATATWNINTRNFIMFSKYDQSDGDIKGYYMEVQFVNNSTDKAELFSVGSEVTESSK